MAISLPAKASSDTEDRVPSPGDKTLGYSASSKEQWDVTQSETRKGKHMLSITTIAEAIGNHLPKFEMDMSINGMSVLKSSLNATIILRETREGINITYHQKGFWGIVSRDLDVVDTDVKTVLAFIDECEEEVSSSLESYMDFAEGE